MKKLLKAKLLLTSSSLLLLFFCFITNANALFSNNNLNNIFLSPSKNHKKCIDLASNEYKSNQNVKNKNITEHMNYIFNKCTSTKKRDIYFSASYCYLNVAGQNKHNNANYICSTPFNKFNSVANEKYKSLFENFKEMVK